MRRAPAIMAGVAAALALATAQPGAHKPITSPYTFNDDIFPIVQTHCGRCHVAGGVAPMALLTHADTVPWGESIRAELLSGHMPPWSVDSSRDRVRHAPGLSARELNMLLTWAAGGTPIGAPEKAPPASGLDGRWPLGPPDVVLPLPAEYAMTAEAQEATVEFTVATAVAEARLVRAVDLLPGNPALVRGAMILLKGASVPLRATRAGGAAEPQSEDVLALWVPGDTPVAADPHGAFVLPAGAELLVRVHYKKTWEYERQAMRDRSLVGLYFAAAPLPEIRSLTLTPAADTDADAVASLSFSTTIDEDLARARDLPRPGAHQHARHRYRAASGRFARGGHRLPSARRLGTPVLVHRTDRAAARHRRQHRCARRRPAASSWRAAQRRPAARSRRRAPDVERRPGAVGGEGPAFAGPRTSPAPTLRERPNTSPPSHPPADVRLSRSIDIS